MRINEGYTLEGAAQELGWVASLRRRGRKILKLPEVGQQLVGSGEIPVSAVDALLAVADVSPQLGEALVASVARGQVAGSRLVNNAGWAIGQALRDAGKDPFGAYLNIVHPNDHEVVAAGQEDRRRAAAVRRTCSASISPPQHLGGDRGPTGGATIRRCEPQQRWSMLTSRLLRSCPASPPAAAERGIAPPETDSL